MTGWREPSAEVLPLETTSNGGAFDLVVEVLLISLLAFMPLALGAVQPWSETVVMGMTAIIAISVLIRAVVSKDASPVATWAFLPVGLFTLLCVAQLLPIPATWVGRLSPATLQTKRDLLQDVSNAAAALKTMTLTFYAPATRHDLRTVLAATTVFVAVLSVVRQKRQILRMLISIVCIAAGVALVAAAQDLGSAEMVYWSIPTPRNLANAGTFIFYNNFAQFMNLSIGAALALLFYYLESAPAGHRVGGSTSLNRSSRSTVRGGISAFSNVGVFSQRNVVLALCGFIVLGTITILLSGSRGGILSMVAAIIVTSLMAVSGKSTRRNSWTLLGIATISFLVLLVVGFDIVSDRLQSLYTWADPSSGRLQTYRDLVNVWKKFPLFGTGLGTHQYVYPGFDHSTAPGLSAQADGDYYQALEETGAIGLVLVLCFAALIWHSTLKALKSVKPRGTPLPASISPRFKTQLACGLSFGLAAVMLHSYTDFGEHLPAVACLTAVICALLIRIGYTAESAEVGTSTAAAALAATAAKGPSQRRGNDGRSASGVFQPAHRRWPAIAASGFCSVAMVWAFISSISVFRADGHAAVAADLADTLEDRYWQGSNEEYTQLLREAAAASDLAPQDVNYRYLLNCYRWRAISRVVDLPTGKLAVTPQILTAAGRIADDLNATRVLCPTYGPTCSVLGQIEKSVLGRPEGDAHVALGYTLWPNHPMACLAAAKVNASDGAWDAAFDKYRRALTLDGRCFPEIMNTLLVEYKRPDLAVKLFHDDPSRLLEVVQRCRDVTADDPSTKALLTEAKANAVEGMKKMCVDSTLSDGMLAETAYLCREQHDFTNATALFRRALATNYAQTDWRLALAQLLKDQGQFADAAHEAQICLRLRPKDPEALKLIGDLSLKTGDVGNLQ